MLLVTHSGDNESIELVSRALVRRRHTPIRLDTDQYPTSVQVSSELVGRRSRRWLTANGKTFDLQQVGALWYRRYYVGWALPEELGDTRPACVDESRRTLYGTIASLGCFQLDPLRAVRRCDHKELQLERARDFGLDVPRTLSTNDPEAVRSFARTVKVPLITKMQHSFAIYREGQEQVVFTTALTGDDLQRLDGLEYSPMTFQEKVPRRLELRATVVGKRVFTASIDAKLLENSGVDWRRDGLELLEQWKPYTLPRAVERSLLRLTKWFGLNYAAADFIVTPEGRHLFLEINAGGEFFWLQRTPGLPIAEALAEVLTTPSARACALEA
ncbi:MAG: MvdD family ATP-grasp ribosomal peptide maturase [Archangium sp.]|nr:MvdD family ATP-grasp ribosomal peptide maturase [Archangium sp.]